MCATVTSLPAVPSPLFKRAVSALYTLHQRCFQPIKVPIEVAVLQIAKRRQTLYGIAQSTTATEVAGDEQRHGHGLHPALPRVVKYRLVQ